jgi:hypothetical protein
LLIRAHHLFVVATPTGVQRDWRGVLAIFWIREPIGRGGESHYVNEGYAKSITLSRSYNRICGVNGPCNDGKLILNHFGLSDTLYPVQKIRIEQSSLAGIV